ncbi:MAG: hypothetical protein ACEQR5_06580, partial [Moraxellaceae bacterium]
RMRASSEDPSTDCAASSGNFLIGRGAGAGTGVILDVAAGIRRAGDGEQGQGGDGEMLFHGECGGRHAQYTGTGFGDEAIRAKPVSGGES